ncbi:unnamed protein product [Ambrosiozyma monospora]|uniref:Unnamed protein product n=1 Tax=Ambrosiozyma monospora TaxID=43982 RepID=A0ACB5TDJ3_AMBMO|nr:unnamed protein product [Ambrosiozyma monospora]
MNKKHNALHFFDTLENKVISLEYRVGSEETNLLWLHKFSSLKKLVLKFAKEWKTKTKVVGLELDNSSIYRLNISRIPATVDLSLTKLKKLKILTVDGCIPRNFYNRLPNSVSKLKLHDITIRPDERNQMDADSTLNAIQMPAKLRYVSSHNTFYPFIRLNSNQDKICDLSCLPQTVENLTIEDSAAFFPHPFPTSLHKLDINLLNYHDSFDQFWSTFMAQLELIEFKARLRSQDVYDLKKVVFAESLKVFNLVLNGRHMKATHVYIDRLPCQLSEFKVGGSGSTTLVVCSDDSIEEFRSLVKVSSLMTMVHGG